MSIGILNAGVGSIHSLENSLRLLSCSSTIVTSPDSLSEISHLILPGVGHFDQGSAFFLDSKWKDSLVQYLNNPQNRLLGICLGMQLLFSSSQESINASNGLSFFDLPIQKLSPLEAKVPNLGWLPVFQKKSTDQFVGHDLHSRDFYFVHSYALVLESILDPNAIFDEYAISWHGRTPFVSMFRSSNIYGCQFHPEKSSRDGLTLLRKFLA